MFFRVIFFVFTAIDYEESEFCGLPVIKPATPTHSKTPSQSITPTESLVPSFSPSPSITPSSSDSNKLNTVEIVGISLGCIFGFVIIVVLMVFVLKKKNENAADSINTFSSLLKDN